MELKEMFEARKMDDLKWVLDDDIEVNEDWLNGENESKPIKTRKRSGVEVIRFLVGEGRGRWSVKREVVVVVEAGCFGGRGVSVVK